jgi:peptidoglycan/LPS O-acetylase OafA/YrhL
MYLLQTPVRHAVDPLVARMTHSTLAKAASFPVIVLVALLVFVYLEEPSRKMLRRKFAAADERFAMRRTTR